MRKAEAKSGRVERKRSSGKETDLVNIKAPVTLTWNFFRWSRRRLVGKQRRNDASVGFAVRFCALFPPSSIQDSLVEPNSNLGQEPFSVLPTQSFPRSILHLLQHVDAGKARLGVDSFEGDVVVLGLEVVLLLFRKKDSEPCEDA